MASKQYVEQGLVRYFAGADVADDSERISEEENKESRADDEDSVDL